MFKNQPDFSCNMAAVDDDLLKPGFLFRPQISESDVRTLIERLYGCHVTQITQLRSTDDRNFYIKVAPNHENHHITELSHDGYVFKVLNGLDSLNDHTVAEHEMQKHLHKHGIICPLPVLNVEGKEYSLEKFTTKDTINGKKNGLTATPTHYIVRLITFIPETVLLRDIRSYTCNFLYQLGQFVATVDNILKNFTHPACNKALRLWNLENLPKMTKYLSAIADTSSRALVQQVLQEFQDNVINHYGDFTKGVIHADVNDTNILIRQAQEGQYNVHAIVDFGDAGRSCYIFEIAITICYMMIVNHDDDPVDIGGHILSGYLTSMELPELDLSVLKLCISARLAQSILMDPTGKEQNKLPLLQHLWYIPNEEIMLRWKDIRSSYSDYIIGSV